MDKNAKLGNPFSTLPDQKLMELYTKGEYQAFEVIYQRYKSRVYSYLQKRMNKNPEAIDDVFQNIFIKFHKAKNKYNPCFPLIKWIYTISRNELLDHLKKKSPELIELQDWHITSENSADESSNHINLEENSNLSGNEKTALELRYFSDKEFLEISQALNTSQANARKLVSRGLNKLRLNYRFKHRFKHKGGE